MRAARLCSSVLPDAKPENPEFQSQNPEKSGKISESQF
jgi:hypothetical protein